MRYAIAVLLFGLAAGQARADGFYQAVTSDTIRAGAGLPDTPASFTFTPLYRQVTGNRELRAGTQWDGDTAAPEFTYTPLYLRVSGQS